MYLARKRAKKAFTLFEAIVTMVVVSVLAGVAVVGVQAASDRSSDNAIATQLESVRAAGRVLAAANAGVFPSDVTDRLELTGMQAIQGPSMENTQVSVWRISETRVGYAVIDGRGGCIGLWDDLERTGETSAVWLRDYETALGNCLGKIVYAQDPRIVTLPNHSYTDPGEIDFDAPFPDPIEGLSVVLKADASVQVSWDTPGGPTADAYSVERGVSLDEDALVDDIEFEEVTLVEAAGTSLPPTFFRDRGAPRGVYVFYRVASRGLVTQDWSPPNDPERTLTPPPKPGDLNLSANQNSTDISFSQVANPEAVIVESYALQVLSQPIRDFAPDDAHAWTHDNSFSAVPWQPGKLFTYSVSACNTSGCGSARIASLESAPAPPAVTAVGGVGSVRVEWVGIESGTPPSPANTTYKVERSIGQAGTAGWVGSLGDQLSVVADELRLSTRSSSAATVAAEAAYGSATNGVAVPDAGTYTATAFWAPGNSTSATAAMRIRWYDAAGKPAGVSTGSYTSSGQLAVSASRPSSARYASPAVTIKDIAKESFNAVGIDNVTFTRAGSTANFLPDGSATFEQASGQDFKPFAEVLPTDAPLWIATNANTAVARATGTENQGGLYARAAGAVDAVSSFGVSGAVPVSPTAGTVSADVAVECDCSTSVTLNLRLLGVGGDVITETSSTVSVTATSGSKEVSVPGIAVPADARFAQLGISAPSVPAGTWLRFDDASLNVGGTNGLPGIASTFSKVGYIDTTVPPGATATYRVVAVNATGVESAPSSASAKATAIPDATLLLSTVGDMNEVHVQWNPLTSATTPIDQWQVWYELPGRQAWANACSSPSTASSCTITGLDAGPSDAGQLVNVVVIPVVGSTFGAASNTLSATTLGKSSTPSALTTQVLTDALVVDWNYPSRDDGYPIQSWSFARNGGSRFTIDEARPTAWWTSSEANDAQTTAVKRSGAGSLQLTATTAGTKSLNFGSTTTKIVPVLDSRSTSFSGCFNPAATRSITLKITPIKRSGSKHTAIQTTQTIPGNTWTCVTTSGTLPFDVYTAALDVSVAGMDAGEKFYADDLSFIVNGAQRLPASIRTFDKLSYLDTGLANGTSYRFNIQASNGYYWSEASSLTAYAQPAHLMVIPQQTSVVSVTRPSNSGGATDRLTVNATAVPMGGSNGYAKYYYYTSGGVYLGATTSTSYLKTGLAAGTNYCYKVYVVNGAGWGPASSTKCAYTMQTPPTGLRMRSGSQRFRSQIMDWNSRPAATGYQLHTSNVAYHGVQTSRARTVSGLAPCTTYKHQVRVQGPWGWSAWSSWYSPRTKCGYAYIPLQGNGTSRAIDRTYSAGWTRLRTHWYSGIRNDAAAFSASWTTVGGTGGQVSVQPAAANHSCPSGTATPPITTGLHWPKPAPQTQNYTTQAVTKVNPSGYFCVYSSVTRRIVTDVQGSYAQYDYSSGTPTGLYSPDIGGPARLKDSNPSGPANVAARTCYKTYVPSNERSGAVASVWTTTYAAAPGMGYATTYPNIFIDNTHVSYGYYDASAGTAVIDYRLSYNCSYASQQARHVIDSQGYYKANVGSVFRPLSTMKRVLDTRSTNDAMSAGRRGNPVVNNVRLKIDPKTFSSEIPAAGITAITGQIHAVNGAGTDITGNGVVYAAAANGSCGSPPNVSTVNWGSNTLQSSSFHVATNSKGQFCLRSGYKMHYILDITGYFDAG